MNLCRPPYLLRVQFYSASNCFDLSFSTLSTAAWKTHWFHALKESWLGIKLQRLYMDSIQYYWDVLTLADWMYATLSVKNFQLKFLPQRMAEHVTAIQTFLTYGSGIRPLLPCSSIAVHHFSSFCSTTTKISPFLKLRSSASWTWLKH